MHDSATLSVRLTIPEIVRVYEAAAARVADRYAGRRSSSMCT